MVVFIFSDLDWKYHFVQIWSKKSILPVLAEICYQDRFKYAEFITDVYFFSFQLEILCWANLVKKIKIVNLNLNLVCRLI